jgi:hypothetical protein
VFLGNISAAARAFRIDRSTAWKILAAAGRLC